MSIEQINDMIANLERDAKNGDPSVGLCKIAFDVGADGLKYEVRERLAITEGHTDILSFCWPMDMDGHAYRLQWLESWRREL